MLGTRSASEFLEMQTLAEKTDTLTERNITHRTHGQRHGPITRLVSHGDLIERSKSSSSDLLVKPQTVASGK